MRIIPVFSLGADYQFSEKTKLTLKGYRNLQDSPSLAGQDYIATGGEFGIEQNLFKNIVFGLAVGYENDTYVSNTDSVTASRVDNFYFFRPSLSYNFLKNLDAEISYEYRANASNFQQDSWFDNRVTLELSLKM